MAYSRDRRLDPDKALEIQMIGESHRWARELTWDQAVDRLRDLVTGRPHIAGRAIGHHLGSYLAHPATTWPTILKAAALLAAAVPVDADLGDVTAAADQVRRNTLSSAYTDPGSQAEREGVRPAERPREKDGAVEPGA